MHVALINPPISSGKYGSKQTSIPPAGIAYLSAYLEKKRITSTIIDGKMEKLSPDDVCERLISLKPPIVGISAMTPDMVTVGMIVRWLRLNLPDTVIVLGGAHAIAIPCETLQEYPEIDFVITGEGEETFVELILALKGELTFQEVRGLGYRDGDKIVINEKRRYISDLNDVPFPAWDKFKQKSSEYFVLSSRGCPYRCIFCMRSLGSQVRERSPENVVNEIEWLEQNFKPRNVVFIDETFTLNKRRVLEITDLLIKKGLHRKIRWVAQTRVDRGDAEVFRRMKEAGCYRVEFGVESGNQEILNGVDKNIRLHQVEETIRLARQAGFKIACTFILGHPYETEATIQDTIDFAVKIKPDFVSFGIMSPYPGTGIWEMAKNGQGNYRLLSSNWEDFLRFGGGALELKNIPRRRLEFLQAKAYASFYIRTFKFFSFFQYCLPRLKQAQIVVKKLISQ